MKTRYAIATLAAGAALVIGAAAPAPRAVAASPATPNAGLGDAYTVVAGDVTITPASYGSAPFTTDIDAGAITLTPVEGTNAGTALMLLDTSWLTGIPVTWQFADNAGVITMQGLPISGGYPYTSFTGSVTLGPSGLVGQIDDYGPAGGQTAAPIEKLATTAFELQFSN